MSNEAWYHSLDPFSRPYFRPKTESPINYILAVALAGCAIAVGVVLGMQWNNTQITSIYQAGQDDVIADQLPLGFQKADGKISFEVLALSTSGNDTSPTGDASSHASIGFTVHQFSCPNNNRMLYVNPNKWQRVEMCGGDPSDCKALSFNTSQSAVFLIRGFDESASSNRMKYAGYDVIAKYFPADNTGIDAELSQIVERDFDAKTKEAFIYQNGRPRYNTQIGSTTGYCVCGTGVL